MSFEELLKKIQIAKGERFPFVIYRKPESDEVEVLIQKDRSLDYVQDYYRSGFIMAPFDDMKKAILFAEENMERYRIDASRQLELLASRSKTIRGKIEDTEAESRHVKLIKKGIDEIKKGRIDKIVLSRCEQYELNNIDVSDVFLRLMNKYPAAFVYVWYHPEVGIWAGASPELLLKTSGANFQTMSLAGTQKYPGHLDVSWGDKEKKEQQIVTDHIIESLDDAQLKVSGTYTRKAGSLLHLCTDINGSLKARSSLKDLIEKLHPTAAICGFPKSDARAFIVQEEGYDRSYYTGFLGEMNMTDSRRTQTEQISKSNLFVNLRCMRLEEKSQTIATVYVGGGITLESDPLAEWKETVDKSFIMKSVLES